MIKFKYKVFLVPNRQAADVLNRLGDEGWELVAVTVVPGGPESVCFMKKMALEITVDVNDIRSIKQTPE